MHFCVLTNLGLSEPSNVEFPDFKYFDSGIMTSLLESCTEKYV